jgi:hypothetical protein
MAFSRYGILLVLSVAAVQAETHFEILVQDMVDHIECFDPETCTPSTGTAWISTLDTGVEYEFVIDGSGPGGLPSAYFFTIRDNGDFPGTLGQINRIEVPWSGPGFRYTYSENYGPFEYFHSMGMGGIPFAPNTIHPGTGCVCDPPAGWVWEECNDGPIQLDQEFVVPAGLVLEIEAGTRIQAFPGALIRVEGALVCQGTAEDGIVFEGDSWHGIEFASGATGELSYTRLTGVADDEDGGALSLEPGSEVALDHCILHHNSTSGQGGAAFVDVGALLRMRSCTVSHNSAGSGGNLYVESGGFATGLYNLVTFGTPHTMISEEEPLASNLVNSMLYPLEDPSQGTGWYCDPGYVDAAGGDFSLSFWNPDNPLEPNCVIDVAVIDGDRDPDGTRADLGALPFDQHDVLQPASILGLADRPGDQGGRLDLVFVASPNDGSVINPVSFYSVWIVYPGGQEFISNGQTVAAIGQQTYELLVPTLRDSTASNGTEPGQFFHHLRVFAHTAMDPALAVASQTVSAYSVDNLSPEPVSGLESDPQWTCITDPEQAWIDLAWNPAPGGDLVHYRILGAWLPDPEQATVLGDSPGPRFRLTMPLPETADTGFTVHVRAVDPAGNLSAFASLLTPQIECGLLQVGEPDRFALLSAYPNPFNPTTRVRFELPSRQPVRLNLFALNGQRVLGLLDGPLPAGLHEVQLDGSRLASGVYILRLQAGQGVETRKLLLLK